MEEKNNKGLIWFIIILIVLILGLVGYIMYDKVFSNEKTIIENNNTTTTTKHIIKENNEKKEYKILTDEEYISYITVSENNKEKIIYNLGSNIHIIGKYKNRVYYSNNESINYVNLDDKELIEIKWLDFPKPQCSEEMCEYIDIDKSEIINDTIYFQTSSFAAGSDSTDGLLSLNLNATKFNDFSVISSLSEQWVVDDSKENIIYLNFYRDDNWVYKYNIKENKSEKLFQTSSYFDHIEYINGNIVYYNFEKKELSLYNINTSKSKVLINNLNNNGNLMSEICSINNGFLYYYDGNGNIMKYDTSNENSSIYYAMNDYSSYSQFYFEDNIMVIYYHGNNYKYILNGKEINSLENIDVVMENNVVKSFSSDKFKQLN